MREKKTPTETPFIPVFSYKHNKNDTSRKKSFYLTRYVPFIRITKQREKKK